MTGVLVTAAPALASSTTAGTSSQTTSWLTVDVSGGSAATTWRQARQAGGGVLLTIWQMPDSDGASTADATADSATVTLTAPGEVIAARRTATQDGATVAAEGSSDGFKVKHGDSKTVFTLTSTGRAQVVFLARADDLKNDDGLWEKFTHWLSGDDDPGTDTPSSTATSTPSSTATDTPSSTATDTPSSTATDTPSSTATDTPSSTATDTPSDAICPPDGVKPTGGDSQGESTAGPSLQEATENAGSDDWNKDGPTAPATFSARARTTAPAANAPTSDCSGDTGAEPPGAGESTGETGEGGGTESNSARQPSVAVGDWESGAAGDPAGIGKARGAAAEVATTWQGADTGLGVLAEGGEYGPSAWGDGKSIILNISPFDDGGSWAKAANGNYDDAWKETARNAKKNWGSRTGDFYYSVAWEMNGSWFNHSVTQAQTADYQKAMARYIEIVHTEFPKAMFTITFNRESNGYDGDSMALWVKGADVMGVDYYNNWPVAKSVPEFKSAAVDHDGGGGPKGIQAWLDAAKQRGVPLIVPEWGGSAREGDLPAYFQSMYDEFKNNAGPGAGQIAAESMFEVDKDDNNWKLLGDTRMPQSAALYEKLWHWVGGAASPAAVGTDGSGSDPSAGASLMTREPVGPGDTDASSASRGSEPSSASTSSSQPSSPVTSSSQPSSASTSSSQPSSPDADTVIHVGSDDVSSDDAGSDDGRNGDDTVISVGKGA